MKFNRYALLFLSLLSNSGLAFGGDSTDIFSQIKSWFTNAAPVSQPCQNCQNGAGGTHIEHAQVVPGSDRGPASGVGSPITIANFHGGSGSSQLSEEALLALEKEKTKQLELANAQKLQEEHERNKWFNALEQYKDQRDAEQAAKNNAEFFRQAHNMMSWHHQTMREIEVERGEAELKRERVRLEGLPQTLAHDLKKTELLHRQSLDKLKLMGKGVMAFTQDKERMTQVALMTSGAALGIYGAKRATKVAADFASVMLMQPALVSETSRKSLKQIILHPLKSFDPSKYAEVLPKAVYNQKIDHQLAVYVNSVKASRAEGQPFRHALFYGLPGTGKTLLAKKIAKELGMNYAIIPGANIHQFSEEEAIRQVNKLFDWAEKSNTVLFFDECDALVPSRTSGAVSEQSRKIQNTIYARTGTETKAFLMIGATNEPELLDPAFLSRLDEHFEFELPDKATRANLIKSYFEKYISEHKRSDVDQAHFDWLADYTNGFSGRELSQLVRAFGAHADVYKEDKRVSKDLMHDVVQQKLAQRKKLSSYSSTNHKAAAVHTTSLPKPKKFKTIAREDLK